MYFKKEVIKLSRENDPTSTDIGDYMKVFACTAVIMQSVLSLVLTVKPSYADQNIIGIIYNLVKFTAPAFIFGILYTTTRTVQIKSWKKYPAYLSNQWSALFVPTIYWTFIYLIVFPNVQQAKPFNSLTSFLWQFINGNAAPHLWYNTMMLQFVILMPFFWSLSKLVQNIPHSTKWILIFTAIFFTAWIYFYDLNVLNGSHHNSWYLLDRIFLSFIIYGILGVVAWCRRQDFEKWIIHNNFIFIASFFLTFYWTNYESFSFGYPVKLSYSPYYKPSMTLYALTVIGLIAIFAIQQINKNAASLPIFHFLATYAYRAYLSNVFWLQIIWRLIGQKLALENSLLAIISCYLLTWGLSFGSAYLFHIIWFKLKATIDTKRSSKRSIE